MSEPTLEAPGPAPAVPPFPAAAPRPALPERPYVGLRPYEENERAIFYGRDRDARYIRDKVFAARLTLLYGLSGCGKSSVLRALVAPDLERQDAAVVQYSDWNAEDCAAAIKARVAALATARGVAGATGAGTIADTVALVNDADGSTVVLILDQFEEFLTKHAQDLDPLRRELGQLVRPSGPDVRVVLALREERLAALEPFRHEILDLFESTYRLDALGLEGLRQAIREPARSFGVEWEEGLVERLLEDLENLPSERVERPGVAAPSKVELPMLQLVCTRIWEAKGKEVRLTGTLYDRLGGARKVLDDYVRSVMPSTPEGQTLTAQLMLSLAPPSGFKQSFTPADLAKSTGLPLDQIAAELERLVSKRIVRARQFRTDTRYELQHDAFIWIIGPWRDEVLERDRERRAARRLRRRRLVAGAIVLAGAISAVVVDQWRYYWKSDHALAVLAERHGAGIRELSSADPQQTQRLTLQLNQDAERTFDNVARYLLDRRGERGRAHLKDLLQEHQELLPPAYGVEQPGGEFAEPEGAGHREVLTLRYAQARGMNRSFFAHTWRMRARELSGTWGLPVPETINLVEEWDFPRTHVELSGLGLKPFGLEIPIHDYFISQATLPQQALLFLQGIDERQAIEEPEWGGPYWAVPRWSLPAFKSYGTLATEGRGGLTAFLLSVHILEHPDRFLGPEETNFLLLRTAGEYPQTVAEARAARGDRLRTDLSEWVKRRYPLVRLEALLDALAALPGLPSGEAVRRLDESKGRAGSSLPAAFHGPWGEPGTFERVSPEALALERSVRGLPPVEADAARCTLGDEMDEAVRHGGLLRPESVLRRLRALDGAYRRFGIHDRGMRFEPDPKLPKNALRLEMLGQLGRAEDAPLIEVTGQAPLDRFEDALRSFEEENRSGWVTAEWVSDLWSELDQPLRDWLQERYSQTDVKLLLRAVLQGGAGAPEGRTVAHADWLLGSLVFWAQAEGNHPAALAEQLRATQLARLEGAPAASDRAVDARVARAVSALEEGRVTGAQAGFARALEEDPAQARRAFLNRYAALKRGEALREELAEACRDPFSVELTQEQRLDAVDLVAHAADLPDSEAWRLRLCAFASTPRLMQPSAAREIMRLRPDPDRWPLDEAAGFGHVVLGMLDQRPDGPELAAFASALIARANQGLALRNATSLFAKVAEICGRPGPRSSCWRLLRQMAEGRPEGGIPALMSAALSTQESVTAAREALAWAERAAEGFAAAPQALPRSKAARAELVKDVRMKALLGMADFGQEEGREEGERLARELLSSKEYGRDARQLLARSLLERQQPGEAGRLVDEALRDWPNDPELRLLQLRISLGAGEGQQAAKESEETLGLADEATGRDRANLLYVAAIGKLLTGSENWELTARRFSSTNHHYRTYVAIMLSAKLREAGRRSDEALEVIESFWKQVDQSQWPRRLQGGDPEVWREMLAGYYLGEVSRAKLFGPLQDDAAFAASDLRLLDLPRRGMLCEAHFYDALVAQSQHDEPRMRQALREAIATGYRGYIEYDFARYLLGTLD